MGKFRLEPFPTAQINKQTCRLASLDTISIMLNVKQAGHAMEWKVVWNGRKILVWNMEDAQNGMKWKI